MALNDVTISLDLAQLLGGDIDTRRTRVYVKTNVANGTLIDTSTGETRLGDEKVILEADGTASFTTWGVGADGNPTSWQTSVVVEYPRAGSRDRTTRTFGPYTITDADDGKTLAELEDQQAIPPNYQTAFTADMESIRDETQAIRDGIVGDLGTTDSQTATLINSPGSLTETALTASIAQQVTPLAEDSAAAFLASEPGVAAAAATAVVGALDTRVALQIGERTSPFAKASRLKWRRAWKKKATGPSDGNSIVLADISGSGVVGNFWAAIAPVNTADGTFPDYDLRVRVYVDGGATPVIDCDAGMFFGYALGTRFTGGPAQTEHMYMKSVGGGRITHGGMRFLMPYSNGIRIELANTTAQGATYIFSQVDYLDAAENPLLVVPPYRLRSDGNSPANLIALGGDYDMHTLYGPGFVVKHTMVAENGTGNFIPSTTGDGNGQAYLERKIGVKFDAETSPSIVASGMEDWFLSSYYYFGQSPYSHRSAMGWGSNNTSPFSSNQTVDLLGLGQPLHYNYKLVLQTLLNTTTEGPQGDMFFASSVLYYKGHTVPVDDLFTRDATTSGLGTAPTGQTWDSDHWGIDGSGEAYRVDGTENDKAMVETGSDHQRIKITLGATVSPNMCIFFGGRDQQNGYLYNTSGRVFVKIVGGTLTNVAFLGGTHTNAAGDTFEVIRKPNGQTEFIENGVSLGTQTDTSVLGGSYAGMFAPTTTCRFTRFEALTPSPL